MLEIRRRIGRNCEGLTRREALKVGSLGLFGLTLPGLLRAEAAAPRCIGGQGMAADCSAWGISASGFWLPPRPCAAGAAGFVPRPCWADRTMPASAIVMNKARASRLNI